MRLNLNAPIQAVDEKNIGLVMQVLKVTLHPTHFTPNPEP